MSLLHCKTINNNRIGDRIYMTAKILNFVLFFSRDNFEDVCIFILKCKSCPFLFWTKAKGNFTVSSNIHRLTIAEQVMPNFRVFLIVNRVRLNQIFRTIVKNSFSEAHSSNSWVGLYV